jgi:hypothetical protein
LERLLDVGDKDATGQEDIDVKWASILLQFLGHKKEWSSFLSNAVSP